MDYEVTFHQIIELEPLYFDEHTLQCEREKERIFKWRKQIQNEIKKDGGVYYLIDQEGLIVYVGRSINLINRLHTHLSSPRLGGLFDSIAIQYVKDIPTQNVIEAMAIAEFLPIENVTGRTQ